MEIKRHYRPEKVKKYEARWYVEGRLKCRFFATEAEREQFIDEFQEQLSQNGTSLLLGFDPAKMRRWQDIAEVFDSLLGNSSFKVRSVQPVRTFWEKAMLLHEESYKPADKKRRKRGMARHYYDLYQLIQHGVAKEASVDHELFKRVADHRKVYFKYTWMDYETLVPGQLRLVPREDQIADWRSDYAGMQREMFYGDVPSFDDVLGTVEAFQDQFNA